MSFTHLDVMKVDLRWQVGSIGLAANVFQALCTQDNPHAYSDVNVITDASGWLTRILAPIEPHVVVNCELLDCNVYKKVGPLWNLIGPAVPTFAPESIGDPLPSGVAALTTAYTYTSKVIGKKYWPGMSETAQTAGLWISGVLAALLQSAIEWATYFESTEGSTTMWHPGVGSLKMGNFQIFSPSVAVRDVPAYQRRRKQGVGV